MKKKVEGEFEESTSVDKLVETLLRSFLKSESNYGLITDIRTDVGYVFRIAKELISEKGFDIYVLRVKNEIYLAKAVERFDDLYDVIKERSLLRAKKGLIEIWDDDESRILHFLVPSLRRHLPIEYENENERERIIETLLESYMD
ncbi:MAG: hypothetical protein QXS79_03460 [Candidatus Bathyarchaeia archaeon]